MRALEVFLNEHLIGTFHGAGLEAIFLDFVAKPPKNKKFRKRLLYGKYAHIQLPFAPTGGANNQLGDFLSALAFVPDAVRLAGEIKLKTPDFHLRELLAELEQLRVHVPGDEAELLRYAASCDEVEQDNRIKQVQMKQRVREANPRSLTKPLSGVRIYQSGDCCAIGMGAVAFAETYSNLLRYAGVRTPGYSEIYIYVATTVEEALVEQALEPWYECTAAVFDIDAYEAAQPAHRVSMLARAYGSALRSIAKIDHLDAARIEPVLKTVEADGLHRDLIATTAENRRYRAEVLYNVTHTGDDGNTPYRLRVTCIASGRTGAVTIDDFNFADAPYSLGKLKLSRNEVVIRARTSLRAKIALKQAGLPSEYRFTIEDVLGADPEPRRGQAYSLGGKMVLPLNR
jgi:hypothetical protein